MTTSTVRRPAFVGLDVETTGLDPDVDRILELGIVVFDDHLEPMTYRSWVTANSDDLGEHDMDEVVQIMHKNSGLLHDIRTDDNPSIWHAEREAVSFLQRFGATNLPMLGSSVSFARSMLQAWMPELLEVFHYRSLDATSVKLARQALHPIHDDHLGKLIDTTRQALIEHAGYTGPLREHRPIYDLLTSAATTTVCINPRAAEAGLIVASLVPGVIDPQPTALDYLRARKPVTADD